MAPVDNPKKTFLYVALYKLSEHEIQEHLAKFSVDKQKKIQKTVGELELRYHLAFLYGPESDSGLREFRNSIFCPDVRDLKRGELQVCASMTCRIMQEKERLPDYAIKLTRLPVKQDLLDCATESGYRHKHLFRHDWYPGPCSCTRFVKQALHQLWVLYDYMSFTDGFLWEKAREDLIELYKRHIVAGINSPAIGASSYGIDPPVHPPNFMPLNQTKCRGKLPNRSPARPDVLLLACLYCRREPQCLVPDHPPLCFRMRRQPHPPRSPFLILLLGTQDVQYPLHEFYTRTCVLFCGNGCASFLNDGVHMFPVPDTSQAKHREWERGRVIVYRTLRCSV
ncbi:hypothetical protein BDV25DRAFT_136671 [Aspergillus avenaceus]|uniref:Uncharacterized protein n=1 Tax=Aspergillus avenaceus TaxID=36643 RepID=A0A5N6U514_ASPAV|nr:hypothetical protein BDV25DRAFT_136671 [Aspergillus avenaceus]